MSVCRATLSDSRGRGAAVGRIGRSRRAALLPVVVMHCVARRDRCYTQAQRPPREARVSRKAWRRVSRVVRLVRGDTSPYWKMVTCPRSELRARTLSGFLMSLEPWSLALIGRGLGPPVAARFYNFTDERPSCALSRRPGPGAQSCRRRDERNFGRPATSRFSSNHRRSRYIWRTAQKAA